MRPEHLRPSRSWPELIELSRARGDRLRRRRQMLRAGPLALVVLASLSLGVANVLPSATPSTRAIDSPAIGNSERVPSVPEQPKQESSSAAPVEPGPKGGGNIPGKPVDPRRPSPEAPAPKNDLVAFTRFEGSTYKLLLIGADGSGIRTLTPGLGAGWSPGAEFIAFSDRKDTSNLAYMRPDGTGLKNIGVRGLLPSWSPDAQWLAFNPVCELECGPECGPRCGVQVVSRDGGRVIRLGDGIWPDWGPDGRIAFTDGIPSEPCTYDTIGFFAGSSGYDSPECSLPLWVMRSDGSGRTRLPVDRAIMPTWSPDGTRIAYYTDSDGVWIVQADGTRPVHVAPVGYKSPSWSADGKWLAMSKRDERAAWRTQTFLRPVDGASEKQLTSGDQDSLPEFSRR